MSQVVTAPISTEERNGQVVALPVAAATKLYAGTIVALNSSGYATFAQDITGGLIAIGRCEEDADNSAGNAGDINVKVKRGVFKFINSSRSSAAYALALADVGDVVFVEDEQTVEKASGSSYRVKAGVLIAIDADGGVWVDMRNTGPATSADTLTALTFSSTPTQAEVQAFRAAVLAIFVAQNIVI